MAAKTELSEWIGKSYYDTDASFWCPQTLSLALAETEQAIRYLFRSNPWTLVNTFALELQNQEDRGGGIDTTVAFVYENRGGPYTEEVPNGPFGRSKTILRSPEKFLTIPEGELSREIEVEPDWGVEVRRAEIPIKRLGSALRLDSFPGLYRNLSHGKTIVAEMPDEESLAGLKLLSGEPVFERFYCMYLPVVDKLKGENDFAFKEDPKHLVAEVHFIDVIGRLRGMINAFEKGYQAAPWFNEEIARLEEQQRIIELTLNAKRHQRDLFHNQVDNALTVFKTTLQEQKQSTKPLIP